MKVHYSFEFPAIAIISNAVNFRSMRLESGRHIGLVTNAAETSALFTNIKSGILEFYHRILPATVYIMVYKGTIIYFLFILII